jgi:hypothetical protein
MARKQVGAIDAELLGRVDVVRGDVPRAKFVERALRVALGEASGAPVEVREAVVDRAAPASPRASAALFERTDLRFGCPVQGCGFRAGSEKAWCPNHGRAVVE